MDISKMDIHHKDRQRANNNANNLVIMTKQEHLKLHQKEKEKL